MSDAAAASGAHLSTLAFSEAGSRSHFWAPRQHGATRDDGHVVLERAQELGDVGVARHRVRLVVAAGPPDSGCSTLWLVPAIHRALHVQGRSTASGCAATTRRRCPPTDVRVPDVRDARRATARASTS